MFQRGGSAEPLLGTGSTYRERMDKQRLEQATQLTDLEQHLSGCKKSSDHLPREHRTSSECWSPPLWRFGSWHACKVTLWSVEVPQQQSGGVLPSDCKLRNLEKQLRTYQLGLTVGVHVSQTAKPTSAGALIKLPVHEDKRIFLLLMLSHRPRGHQFEAGEAQG